MALSALKTVRGDFLLRVASAVVLAPLALAVAYVGSPAYEAALMLIAGVLAWEWTILCNSRRPAVTRALLATTAFAAVLAVMAEAPMLAGAVIAAGALAAGAAEGDANGAGGRRAWIAVGAVYIALPLAACEWLRVAPHGREIVIWLLTVVWASDTVAYLFGRAFGGPKLAPAISPKKTWSGLGGAVIGAAMAGVLVAQALGSNDQLGMGATAAVFGLAGQAGDLLESSVKRHFGVKDTSRLIPGHGGLFDRLDALLAVVVLAALFHFLGWSGGAIW
jgi:phosphatidate cytidylyltransferase